MKNSCYSKFVSKILNIEYSDAIQIFKSLPNAEREITILSVAEENEMAVYPFMLSLLKEHNSLYVYKILDAVLSCALCYIEGAYQMAVYHLKQQINRYPDDLDSKIRILELYYIPDVYAERRDYLKYAEEILEKDSNNPVALGFVTNKVKGDYGSGMKINDLFEKIKYLHFDEAYNMIFNYDSDRIYNEIYRIAENSNSMVVYLFIEYLLEKEDSIFYNMLAFDVLTLPLSRIGGAQYMAAYHAYKLIGAGDNQNKYRKFVEELRSSLKK